jgi:hypothetical protein
VPADFQSCSASNIQKSFVRIDALGSGGLATGWCHVDVVGLDVLADAWAAANNITNLWVIFLRRGAFKVFEDNVGMTRDA